MGCGVYQNWGMKTRAESAGRCPKRSHDIMLHVMAPNHFGLGGHNLRRTSGDPFALGDPLPQGQPLCGRNNPFAHVAAPLPQGQPLCPWRNPKAPVASPEPLGPAMPYGASVTYVLVVHLPQAECQDLADSRPRRFCVGRASPPSCPKPIRPQASGLGFDPSGNAWVWPGVEQVSAMTKTYSFQAETPVANRNMPWPNGHVSFVL